MSECGKPPSCEAREDLGQIRSLIEAAQAVVPHLSWEAMTLLKACDVPIRGPGFFGALAPNPNPMGAMVQGVGLAALDVEVRSSSRSLAVTWLQMVVLLGTLGLTAMQRGNEK